MSRMTQLRPDRRMAAYSRGHFHYMAPILDSPQAMQYWWRTLVSLPTYYHLLSAELELRAADTRTLPPGLRQARQRNLDRLRQQPRRQRRPATGHKRTERACYRTHNGRDIDDGAESARTVQHGHTNCSRRRIRGHGRHVWSGAGQRRGCIDTPGSAKPGVRQDRYASSGNRR